MYEYITILLNLNLNWKYILTGMNKHALGLSRQQNKYLKEGDANKQLLAPTDCDLANLYF